MTKKYPMTYEEYEQKIKTLFLQLYPQDKQGIAEERLNNLLQKEPEFIKGLYEETCFRYDHDNIYGEGSKNVFKDPSLNAIPVNTLNMLLGGKLE